jgi:sialate O-acetylesterase
MKSILLTCLTLTAPLSAEVTLSNLFSDHMVLQRDQAVPVWGSAEPGEDVTVTFAGQTVSAKANAEGAWTVKLEALKTSAEPRILTAKGKNEVQVSDVLVGEVWICSGQSNMGHVVNNSINGDLDALSSAPLGKLRLLTLSTQGSQTPVKQPDQKWATANEKSIPSFSAVGFYFGRQLLTALDVPIGLINNSWGGSACEAWIRRDLLEGKEVYAPMMERWKKTESDYDSGKEQAKFNEAMTKWKAAAEAAKAAGKPEPKRPQAGQNQMTGQHRPANLYNGRLKPLMPMAFRGAIWYQGESNASRAYQYRDMFPLMIKNWRDDWGMGSFPFYWVQLADYQAEKPEPGDSAWAELREAQTLSLATVPNSGQAVIDDLGEANDIHPRKKHDVGLRLARWALAKDYGVKVAYQSPTYSSMETQGNKIIVTLKEVGPGLKPLDVAEIKGFAIAGEDKKWHWAQAKLNGQDKIEVTCPDVPAPVAVRYAWADNPICNLYSTNGLPVTPFRTDTWPGVTAEVK